MLKVVTLKIWITELFWKYIFLKITILEWRKLNFFWSFNFLQQSYPLFRWVIFTQEGCKLKIYWWKINIMKNCVFLHFWNHCPYRGFQKSYRYFFEFCSILSQDFFIRKQFFQIPAVIVLGIYFSFQNNWIGSLNNLF